ncbi:Fc.00g071450.m01.CDS01 [Cosmosporella sp. VM-42]
MNAGLGKTSLECACDIPSHAYQYPWAPNPEWKKFYSGAEDLWAYFKGVAEKQRLLDCVKLRHKVVGAKWSEQIAKWCVTVETGGATFTDEGDFLINAGGILNEWKWPSISELHSFEGKLMHSAEWDVTYDFNDKRIAVIGGGSSAVRIVPSLQPLVKAMKTFIRSPTWISGNYAKKYAGPNGQNFEYSEEQRQLFQQNPKLYLECRKGIENELNSRFRFIMKDSDDQKEIAMSTSADMRAKLAKKPHLADQLIPKFAFGCRRPTPGNGYLEALVADNVDPVFTSIDIITPQDIRTSDGIIHKVDTIAKETPKSYMSLMVDGFPNYFTSLGPHSPVGHGSLIPIIETVADYMVTVLKKVQRQTIKVVDVKRQAVNDFTEHTDEFMKRAAWSDGCSSSFKNGKVDGPVVAIWPGSRMNWFEALREPRFEDFNYTYETANRFQYFGDGFTQREIEGFDLTWYLDNPDV